MKKKLAGKDFCCIFAIPNDEEKGCEVECLDSSLKT
jgi:hypothetical protein